MSKLEFEAFHLCTLGASHIKESKVCQDYALSGQGSDYAVAIVCDGHGGNKYFRSDRGSRLAAEQAHASIIQFMKTRFVKTQSGGKVVDTIISNPDAFMTQLATNIIFRWREKVEEDYFNEPFTSEETEKLSTTELASLQLDSGWVAAYGSTMIATVRAKDFWFGLHIGDGKCVVVNSKGEFTQPIPWDPKCFLNVTTSICDINALSNFRFYTSLDNLPMAIFLGTDGIDDTFGTDEALHQFYNKILSLFSSKGFTEGINELNAYLPTLSEKGSKDDISIAGVIDKKSFSKWVSREVEDS